MLLTCRARGVAPEEGRTVFVTVYSPEPNVILLSVKTQFATGDGAVLRLFVQAKSDNMCDVYAAAVDSVARRRRTLMKPTKRGHKKVRIPQRNGTKHERRTS